jgi:hypothetical protein
LTIAQRARHSPPGAPAGFSDGEASIGFAIAGRAAEVIAALPGADAAAMILEIYRAMHAARVEPLLDEVAPPPGTPLAAMRRLRRLAARAPGPDGGWLRERLIEYERLASAGASLDVSLGIAAPGRDSWPAEERRERRDEAIRRLGSIGFTAPQIVAAIASHKRRRITNPSPGEKDRLLDAICAADPPTSEGGVRRILRNKKED